MSRHPVDRKLRLQIIFAFIFIFSILLFVFSSQHTRLQMVFRIAAAIVGLTGFLTVSRRERL